MTNDDNRPVYRILDASLNRAGEGLRTMEELARFVLNDPVITAKLKSLRHDLSAAMSPFPRDRLLLARDTDADVGTNIGEPSEYDRANLSSVLSAAASRVQQSMRVLEECSKTLDVSIAAELEQIRYRCYTVSGQLELQWPGHDLRARLKSARLYALVDAGSNQSEFTTWVTRLYEAGVDVCQLRDQNADDRKLIQRAQAGTEIARQHDGIFIMNDRADLALAADADGVHLGQEELPASVARQIVGPHRLIGISTHSIQQAREAVSEGADYVGCGPVFAGNTKSFESYVGTSLLKQLVAEIEIPSFAIGGIDLSNVDQVVDAGFGRIAVTGAIRDAEDPTEACRQLKRILERTST